MIFSYRNKDVICFLHNESEGWSFSNLQKEMLGAVDKRSELLTRTKKEEIKRYQNFSLRRGEKGIWEQIWLTNRIFPNISSLRIVIIFLFFLGINPPPLFTGFTYPPVKLFAHAKPSSFPVFATNTYATILFPRGFSSISHL